MIGYIYCYTNKINNKKYVGQTNNPLRRKSEHKYAAFHPSHSDYNNLFHKKIREYGEENFIFEILEIIECEDKETINEKERYWIEKCNSYVKNNQGYNISKGGDTCCEYFAHSIINEEQFNIILNDIINSKTPLYKLDEKYGLTKGYCQKINSGNKFFQKDLAYPLRPTRSIDCEPIIEYLSGKYLETNEQLAKKFNVSTSTIKRIKRKLKQQ